MTKEKIIAIELQKMKKNVYKILASNNQPCGKN